MPVTPTYPGVYIEEVPSGVRAITGVATSIGAFIGFFKKGSMNKAVQIFNMGDFQREFGGLDDRSEASYAISQFFLNGGSEAHVIRVAKSDTTNPLQKAGAKIKAGTGAGATVILEITAQNEGIWGNNLCVDIDHNTSDPTKLFNMKVVLYDSPAPKARELISERFLNLSVDSSNARYVESVVNDESKLINVRHAATSSTQLPAATGTVSGDILGLTQAQLNGLSGKKFKVQIGDIGPKEAELESWSTNDVQTLQQLRAQIQKAIRRAEPTSPLFTGATVEVIGGKHLRIFSGKGAENYSPTDFVAIKNFSSGDTTAATLKLTGAGLVGNNVQEYVLGLGTPGADIAALKRGAKGADGTKPGADEIVGNKDLKTGLYALEDVDLFNILCVPSAADLSSPEMTQVVNKALKFCEDRRAFMIVDIPSNIDEVQEIKDWLEENAGSRHKNAALYFPRIMIPDPENEYRLREVGAGGTIAGLYSRTDGERGVWKAPAGTEACLRGVQKFSYLLTDMENGTLNPLGINCLRKFDVYGTVCWGARTLDGADQIASEWKYIPIRRLALFIEESLYRGTKWVVFEPNDEPLWAQIRLNVSAFMHRLFRQGAFQGTTPKEAYFVKCDSETTTDTDRNLGIVNIVVGFAPLKPAEFVIIKIQQIAGQNQT